MTGTCVDCGGKVPVGWNICSVCRAHNNYLATEDPHRIRCFCCQQKASKVLVSGGSHLADIIWSQCEGTIFPEQPCVLWHTTLEVTAVQ